jgi:uncharacterized XkdX family phage protein
MFKVGSMFLFVKLQYQMGNYTIDDVKTCVVRGYITPEQFKEITGIDYVAD